MDDPNLPTAYRAIAERFGPRPALRFKRHGLFHDLTWTEYRSQADHAAAGLIGLGVEPGDAVAILSENRHEWLVADIAILTAGAVNVPLHAPLSPSQVEYQLGHSRAKGVFVSNQTQADKVLASLDSFPDLGFLVAFEPVCVGDRLDFRSWEGLKQRGAKDAKALAEARRRESAIGLDDLATIIYTSGTTGLPKGVMLSQGNLLSNARMCGVLLKTALDEVQLSWLPYSHIYARTCDHYATAFVGATLCLAESMDTILADFHQVGATRMNSVPRFYEKVWASVERLAPEERSARVRAIFGPSLRMLTSGGAPLPLPVAAGFAEAGLLLLEGYGQTESSPVITFSGPGAPEARLGRPGDPRCRGPDRRRRRDPHPRPSRHARLLGRPRGHEGDDRRRLAPYRRRRPA